MVEDRLRREAPQAFLSYAHHDDKFLRGAIQHLREDLEDAIRFVTGEPFEIFLDTDGTKFGQHWPTQLASQLKAARFLIPILSPNYFQSEACKQEALTFMQYEAETGRNDLVLPIYLADTPFIDDPEINQANTLTLRLSERQYRDYRELVFEDRTSAKRSQFVKELAAEIGQASNRVDAETKETEEESEAGSGSEHISDPSIVEQALNESSVLITLSRRRIAIGRNIVDTMRQFWHFLNKLYSDDQSDHSEGRIFIWVIDVGSRLAEQPFSFDEYFNAGLLALQFQAFSRFDSINDYDEASRSRLFPRLHTAHPIHRNKRCTRPTSTALISDLCVAKVRPY